MHILDADLVISKVNLALEILIIKNSTLKFYTPPPKFCTVIGLNWNAVSKKMVITAVRVIRMDPATNLKSEVLI